MISDPPRAMCVAVLCSTSRKGECDEAVPVHRCPLGRLAADATGDRTPCACMLPDIMIWIPEPRRRLAMLAQHQPLDAPAPRPSVGTVIGLLLLNNFAKDDC